MGVWQPGVEGHQRQLDAKAHQQGRQQHDLATHRQPFAGDRRETEIDRAREQGQAQEGPQDQHARHGREDQELGGRIGALVASPDRDQQPEGDQFKLIEQEEEQQVFGQKGAIHRPTNQQQHREIDPRPLAEIPGANRRHQGEGSIDQHQGQREPIHTQLVVETDAGHPAVELFQLHAPLGGIKHQQQGQAGEQLGRQQPNRDAPQPTGAGFPWPEQQGEASQKGNGQQQAQPGEGHQQGARHQRTTSPTIQVRELSNTTMAITTVNT